MLNKTQIAEVAQLAYKAALAILELYESSSKIETTLKSDHTPVTEADLLADKIIQAGLQEIAIYPTLSEETVVNYEERQTWDTYWLVDPLDGTKEFIEKTGEFSINIALVHQHEPIFGLIYHPLKHSYYYAWAGLAYHVDEFGKEIKLRTKPLTSSHLCITMSRRHGRKKIEPFISEFANYEIIECGSALKFGLLAAGLADIYPRFGPSSEWDTAAGQCILEAAGGRLMNLSGNVLQYNAKESLLNPDFIAVGDFSYPWLSRL